MPPPFDSLPSQTHLLSGSQNTYTADSSRPALAQFTFDLDEGGLILEFNETVGVSTIQLSQFLQQSIPFTTSVDVRLTTTSLSGGNTASPDILIERADLNEIKRLPVCTSNLDCYLSFPETVLNDTNGNRVVEIIRTEAVLVANFTPDTTELHSKVYQDHLPCIRSQMASSLMKTVIPSLSISPLQI